MCYSVTDEDRSFFYNASHKIRSVVLIKKIDDDCKV